MEYPILISTINDFIFCPISIYFHMQYDDVNRMLFQENRQINGSFAHKAIDEKSYSTRKNVLQAKDVYCEKYGLIGKIDLFDVDKGILVERKKHINKIYDGYIFQLYAQYFALSEMGYTVKELQFYSYDDNKVYPVKLPEQDEDMLIKFEKVISDMKTFDIFGFLPENNNKCGNCIYRNMCDRSIADD